MKYKENWKETKTKFINWWAHKNTGTPLMIVIAKKEKSTNSDLNILEGDKIDDKYRNAELIINRYKDFCENHNFLAESFPNLSVDFGPGSLAAYLGSNIVFGEDTVWFEECIEDWETAPAFKFDPENKWWREHFELVKGVKNLSNGKFIVCIPDLIENLDILSSLRGAQNLLYDMIDDPEVIENRVKQIDNIYFEYYNRFYDLLKDKDESSSYTVFQIWGKGKTGKIQCDFSAMISPSHYIDFVKDSIRFQAKNLDNVLYHLDGIDAIKHLDAILEIDEIDAIQWTSGDHGPDGTLEEWYEIYDKVIKKGKSLWIKVYNGTIDDWIANTDKLVKRYGSHSLLLFFPIMIQSEANKLLKYAKENWSDIEGHFR